MMLFTFHIVVIGVLIGVTANTAFSFGKKDGLRIARMEQEYLEKKKQEEQNINKAIPVDAA